MVMIISYLLAWGFSVMGRLGWGQSWAREVGGLSGFTTGLSLLSGTNRKVKEGMEKDPSPPTLI